METCDEASAKFMAESLLDHAKEIYRYAKTFCEPTLANQAIDENIRKKFHRTVERMINEMHALMLMAQYKGVSRYCNQEQIEAYMDEARQAIAHTVGALRQSEPMFN